MLGIVLHLPPTVANYLLYTPLEVLAAHALLAIGWIPILGVLVWGFSHIWVDYKQEQFEHHKKWVSLEVKVPQQSIQTPKGMENFFSNLAGTKSGVTWKEHWLIGKEQGRFSFELISRGGQISFVIRCWDQFRDIVEADLYAQYPDAQISVIDDYAKDMPDQYPNDHTEMFGGELILGKPSYLPLRTYDDFEHQGEKDNRFKDPLLPILELMGKLTPGENLWIQIIIKPPEDDAWVKEGLKYLGAVMGKEEKKHKKSMMEEATGMVSALPMEVVRQIVGFEAGKGGGAEKKNDDFRMFKLTSAEKIQIDHVAEKVSKVGWRAKIRWVSTGPKGKFRKGLMAAGMKGAFQPFSSPLLNSLGVHGPSVPKDDYFWQAWSMPAKQTRLVKRFRNRSFSAGSTPYVLNAEELASLWHFPSADARTPVLTQLGSRRSEAPTSLPFAPGAGVPSAVDWKAAYMESRGLNSAGGESTSNAAEPVSLPALTVPEPVMDATDHDSAPHNLPI